MVAATGFGDAERVAGFIDYESPRIGAASPTQMPCAALELSLPCLRQRLGPRCQPPTA